MERDGNRAKLDNNTFCPATSAFSRQQLRHQKSFPIPVRFGLSMPTPVAFSSTSVLGSSTPNLGIFSNTGEVWDVPKPHRTPSPTSPGLEPRALFLANLGRNSRPCTYLMSVWNVVTAGANGEDVAAIGQDLEKEYKKQHSSSCCCCCLYVLV